MSKESLPLGGELGNGFDIRRYLTPAAILGLIVALGTALRLYDLGKESYFIEEIYTVTESKQSIYQLLTSGRLDQPPAYYLPFHLWMQIIGSSEAGTRLFSALAGVGSIILVYVIGRELFGKEVGLLGSFIMSISEYQIFYSQETRFYALFELMTLLSFLFYIHALRSKRTIHFVLYVACSILMLYSHTLGVFTLIAQNVFFLLQVSKYRSMLTSWLICQTVILLGFGPYLSFLVLAGGGVTGTISSNAFGNYAPPLLGLLRSIYQFVIPPRRDLNWGTIFAGYAVAGILLVLGTWINTRRQGKHNLVPEVRALLASLRASVATSGLLLLSCWFVLPILLAYVLSILITPIYADRYMISATPALYLLLAAGIFKIRKIVPIGITLAAMVIISAPSLSRYYQLDVHEQWKEAAAYVDQNARPGDVLVLPDKGDKDIYARSFYWYSRGGLASCGWPHSDIINSAAVIKHVIQCTSGNDRFWVILVDSPDPYEAIFTDPSQTNWQMLMSHHFVDVEVYLFELRR